MPIAPGPFVGPGIGTFSGEHCLNMFMRNVGCANRKFYLICLGRLRKESHYEQLGSYDPMPNSRGEVLVSFNYNRLMYWLGTDYRIKYDQKVLHLLGLSGFFPIFHKTIRLAFNSRTKMNDFMPKLPEGYDFSTKPLMHGELGICGVSHAAMNNAKLKEALNDYQDMLLKSSNANSQTESLNDACADAIHEEGSEDSLYLDGQEITQDSPTADQHESVNYLCDSSKEKSHITSEESSTSEVTSPSKTKKDDESHTADIDESSSSSSDESSDDKSHTADIDESSSSSSDENSDDESQKTK